MTVSHPRILPVVLFALIGFAGLRAADLWFGFAAADAAVEQASADAEAGSLSEAPAPAAPASEAERRLLEALASRREALDAREAAIETREKVLQAAELQLDARLAGLAAERSELEAMRKAQELRQAAEFESLSNAYERMKARDAARIFDVLEADILVPVAAGMRTQALSGVLAEMQPEKARTLTRLLADHNRRTGAGTEAP